MKQGWEYKKLGEVCTIERGGSPRPITDYITDSEDGINWIKIGDAQEGSKYITSTKEKIRPEGLKKSRFVHKGDFILSNSMSFGRPYILKVDGCIHDGWLVIHDDKEVFIKDYLYYILSSPIMYAKFSQLAVGGVVNNLNSSLVRKVTIPLPPKSTQLSIVSELDKINELIRLKKGQLKDYDNLAQSIFYEMFGDPVENDKGWEVKELGQLCEVTSSKRVFINEVVDAGVPFIRGTELTALNKLVPGEKMHYTLFITQEHYERLKAITGVPKVGDLLIPSINADGIVWMVDTEKPLYFKDGRVLWIHVNHNHFNSIAIQKLMNILIKNIYASMGGATFAELKLFVLRNMKVPIPPLSVQDAFAEKIKRIDIQKLQVKKSITDLETLLASRMQYWFE